MFHISIPGQTHPGVAREDSARLKGERMAGVDRRFVVKSAAA